MNIENKKKICVVGINPSWQRTLAFKNFRPGNVNRAYFSDRMASGKGINFSRAARAWGIAEPVVYQFIGGETGRSIEDYLQQEGMSYVSERVDAPTRVCTTVLDEAKKEMSELIEPSAEIPEEAGKRLLDRICCDLKQCDAAALCGTYPSGIGPDFYASVTAAAKKNNCLVLADVCKGILPSLEAGVDVLKINRNEMKDLTGTDDVGSGTKILMEKYPLRLMAVTDGPDPAWLADGTDLFLFDLPELDKVVNPVGSGDTCSAVFLSCLVNDMPPVDAFRFGLAASMENCRSIKPAVFDVESAKKLVEKIQIRKK